MPRIPEAFINELVSRSDIVEVIESHVPLKKSARDYMACCPFHTEKTPSFSVSAEKQFYHCFGCGAHGTVLGFLMEYLHLDFVSAVEHLAARYGLILPISTSLEETVETTKPLYEILQKCETFYRHQLKQSEEAISYLKSRGLTGEIAKHFALGYSASSRLLSQFRDEKQVLLTSGMLIQQDDGNCYDRFRQRIMIPIRDQRGRTIAFGGRVLGDAKPKYLNSPETPLFHKRRELFGLYEVKKALRHISRILVVEGYMDVIALAQHGISNAVATLGTSVTAEHVRKLFRVCQDVVFCFDGDEAGRRAAWRTVSVILPLIDQGQQVRFLFLPEGEDPDSWVHRLGEKKFLQAVDSSKLLSEYFFEELISQSGVDVQGADGKARFIALAKPLIMSMSEDNVFRGILTEMLAKKLNVNVNDLWNWFDGSSVEKIPEERSEINASKNKINSPVRTLIILLLHYPDLASSADIEKDISTYSIKGVSLLCDVLELLKHNKSLSSQGVIDNFIGTEYDQSLVKLLKQPFFVTQEGAKNEFIGALNKLKEQQRDWQIQQLQNKARTEKLSDIEKQKLRDLLK